jgi:hypothetical protein
MQASSKPMPAVIMASLPTTSTGRYPAPDARRCRVPDPSDPCSAWTAKANKRVQFGYGLNYLIDIGIAAARLRRANYAGSTVMSASANRLPSGR